MTDVENEILWAAVSALDDLDAGHPAPAPVPFLAIEPAVQVAGTDDFSEALAVTAGAEIARLRGALGAARRWHSLQADTCEHVGQRASAFAHRERIADISKSLGDKA